MKELVKYKICKSCCRKLPITAFAKNQHNKNNVIVRRSVCKECCKKEKRYPTISPKLKLEYQEKYPPLKIGSHFKCPVCDKVTIVTKGRGINLDHNHHTGGIRGYVCNRCNTGMGNLRDDTNVFARAIQWVKGTLRSIGIFQI